jgi:transketolase
MGHVPNRYTDSTGGPEILVRVGISVSDSAALSRSALAERAYRLRRSMLEMTRDKGEGYIAQGLAIADCLAVLYFHALRHDPARPDWPDRDRFVLSTGHYSLAMYAVLAEAGYLDAAELPSYGLDGSALPMSTFDTTTGVEVVGGSLGQGLGQAVGMALGLRLDGRAARVYCELSDGELQEGSTWEAAMAGATFGCDNLVALVDCNGVQADGPVTVALEPVAAKWVAFGWDVSEVDGNDVDALAAAVDGATDADGRPKVVVMRTTPGFGVASLMARPRAHFVRMSEVEWHTALSELDSAHTGGAR